MATVSHPHRCLSCPHDRCAKRSRTRKGARQGVTAYENLLYTLKLRLGASLSQYRRWYGWHLSPPPHVLLESRRSFQLPWEGGCFRIAIRYPNGAWRVEQHVADTFFDRTRVLPVSVRRDDGCVRGQEVFRQHLVSSAEMTIGDDASSLKAPCPVGETVPKSIAAYPTDAD